jgi:hypothetical protein
VPPSWYWQRGRCEEDAGWPMHSCGNKARKGRSWPNFWANLASFSLWRPRNYCSELRLPRPSVPRPSVSHLRAEALRRRPREGRDGRRAVAAAEQADDVRVGGHVERGTAGAVRRLPAPGTRRARPLRAPTQNRYTKLMHCGKHEGSLTAPGGPGPRGRRGTWAAARGSTRGWQSCLAAGGFPLS